MPTTARAGGRASPEDDGALEAVVLPEAGPLIDAVVAYTRGDPARHAVVMGGFGAGKSHSLRRAAELARAGGVAVAWLERGPIGISSYTDFLVAVAKAMEPGAWTQADIDARRGESTHVDETAGERVFDAVAFIAALEERLLRRTRLVIVIESLDQLLHQVRASDRPRLLALLERGMSGPLIVGSVHGGWLADELEGRVEFVAAEYLPTIAAGLALARQEAQLHGLESPPGLSRIARQALDLDATTASNWLFWSLVGRYLVIAQRDVLRWAVEDLKARAASHFDALLLTLAPSEQRIVLALAEAGEPRTVGELADAIGVRNQAVATALGRLHADDWVKVIDGAAGADRRKTWYEIADPMLRLHLVPDTRGVRSGE